MRFCIYCRFKVNRILQTLMIQILHEGWTCSISFQTRFYLQNSSFSIRTNLPSPEGPCIWIVSIIFHFFHSDDQFHVKNTQFFFMTQNKWTSEVECLPKFAFKLDHAPTCEQWLCSAPCPVLLPWYCHQCRLHLFICWVAQVINHIMTGW